MKTQTQKLRTHFTLKVAGYKNRNVLARYGKKLEEWARLNVNKAGSGDIYTYGHIVVLVDGVSHMVFPNGMILTTINGRAFRACRHVGPVNPVVFTLTVLTPPKL